MLAVNVLHALGRQLKPQRVQWTQDRSQRAQWLRECLACWSTGAGPDDAALHKLSQVVRCQSALSPAHMVDILQASPSSIM